MTDKSDDEPKLLHCSDKCGAAIPATEKALLSSGWTYLETARRFRCGACMRALAAAATLPGTSLAASVDTLPRNSIGALKKPTADTIVPPVVKP